MIARPARVARPLRVTQVPRRARRAPGAPMVLALALAVAVAAPAWLVTPSATLAANTDLTLVTDAVYTVRPEDGRIAVSVAIEARNHTTETRTRRFYFDHAFLALQPGATGVRMTGPRGARARVAKRTRTSTLVRLDFGSRLYSGQDAALRLTYDLAGTGKAASPQVRVGSSLVTLPVWAFASAGGHGSTVTVRFPAGWDVAVESGALERQVAATGTTLTSGPIESPLTFFAYVTAQRPAVFVERAVTLAAGDQPVALVLRGWQDDPAWGKRIERLFGRALPVLREDIGQPWPLATPLVIEEAVSRDVDAVEGLYDPAEGRMEVAWWADGAAIVHQVAHGWFGGTLVADRWANEGFATYYALRAAAALEVPAKAPELTDESAAAAMPLDGWAGSSGIETPADAYAAATSYRLATSIADRVGPDVLTAVWADAAARVGAYQPRVAVGSAPGDPAPGGPAAGGSAASLGAPELVAGAPDWRGLLDLLEERSGEDLVPLWRDLVVRPEQAPMLDARAAARGSYGRTLAIAGDWALPRAIRDALRAWDFEAAESLMADARTVLAQRNAVAEQAGRAGLRLPQTMESMFESGALREASARGEAEDAAILAIEQATDARSVEDDVLSRIGMLGEHPETDLAAARASFEAGDLDATFAAADRALRAWTVSWEEGRRRALVALAALATVLVLGSAMVSNLLHSRRGTARPRRPMARPRPGGPDVPSPDDHTAHA